MNHINKYDLEVINIINNYIITDPDCFLSTKEIIEFLMQENYDLWKKCNQYLIINYIQNEIVIYSFDNIRSKLNDIDYSLNKF